MADNVPVTPGSGINIAADDVGGVLFQRVKLTTGADGTANDVSVANPVPVDQISSAYRSSTTITRPANTTTYGAGDIISGPLTFAGVGPTAGNILITGASLEIDINAIPSGMTGFRLCLYTATPPSALTDNAVFNLSAADRASFVGYIDFDTPVDLGDTLFSQIDTVNKQVKLAAGSSTLYAYLITNGAFTPGSADVLKVTLNIMVI